MQFQGLESAPSVPRWATINVRTCPLLRGPKQRHPEAPTGRVDEVPAAIMNESEVAESQLVTPMVP